MAVQVGPEYAQKTDLQFKSVFGTDKNTAQAALIEHEKYFCMAFRGTNELEDWLDNIDVFPTKQLFGEFHRGFWKSVDDVWEPIFNEYKKLNRQKRRPLFLTGHSLGGAMATIAAAKLIHLDLPFISVYTFGQPRALTHETARIYNVECKSRFFRFHNNNDIVTRIPSREMNYSHIGTYLYISHERKIYQEVGKWFIFLDSVEGALRSAKQKGLDGIEDHNIDKYLEAIQLWSYQR